MNLYNTPSISRLRVFIFVNAAHLCRIRLRWRLSIHRREFINNNSNNNTRVWECLYLFFHLNIYFLKHSFLRSALNSYPPFASCCRYLYIILYLYIHNIWNFIDFVRIFTQNWWCILHVVQWWHIRYNFIDSPKVTG